MIRYRNHENYGEKIKTVAGYNWLKVPHSRDKWKDLEEIYTLTKESPNIKPRKKNKTKEKSRTRKSTRFNTYLFFVTL